MKKFSSLWGLAYWQSGEYQVIEERLSDHEKAGHTYCPSKLNLFRALDLECEKVRAVIVGQDPYPNPSNATGVAFSVPEGIREGNLPPTLKNIFKEYESDLHYPAPKNGDLTTWVNQGVLLWNAYPSCTAFKPGSHHWDEWKPLTEEILRKIDGNNKAVFILLGAIARGFRDCIVRNPTIETSHPSPLGANKGFLGSRIFSRANAELCRIHQPAINWRLPDATGS